MCPYSEEYNYTGEIKHEANETKYWFNIDDQYPTKNNLL